MTGSSSPGAPTQIGVTVLVVLPLRQWDTDIMMHGSPQSTRPHRPHVCMVVHSHYPVREPRAEREALAAVEAGYAVDVICLRLPGEPASEILDDIRITRLPIRHVRGAGAVRAITEYVGFALRAALTVVRIHRESRIDILYIHAPPDFLIAAALIPRLLGSKVVLDIHDLSPHMFDARFGGRPAAQVVQRALRQVERVACSLADRVITVHDPYRAELIAHGVPAEKIYVVMNAPAADVLGAAQAAVRNGRTSNDFVVAYHGTVTHWYGVDLIVDAIALLEDRLPRLRGLILGEGDALSSAEALAHRRGVASRIDFSNGFVSHVEALTRVAGASCGVIPNRPSHLNRFALSSKLLEYVSLGIPAVVARLETLEAHFSTDEVTFFEPGSAESLAEAIAWVADHPTEARVKAEHAQGRAQQYSWSASRARLLETLSDTTSKARTLRR
jgi:glycosyltransferase involved in cell wall biosynthesis